METYNRFPLELEKGKGCWVWDSKGKKYLDAVAGIATCSLGHSDQALRRSLTEQLKKLQHVSNLYQIPEQEALANWLVEHSCANKVFFCNSGAEANEAAIKLARKYGHLREIEKPIILTSEASFHGRTLATMTATGQTKYHKGFKPLVEGFEYFKYNDLNSFKNVLNSLETNKQEVVAVLIEPLQGEGGIIQGDPKFFFDLRELCTQKNIFLIFDEVQTGIGRTGKWWGYEQLGVTPDAFTIAKGLGGGHAIGALLVKDHANLFEPGDHASTFGGNPFACKAGLTVVTEIEKRSLLLQVNKQGYQLNEGLNILARLFPKQIKEVRGWGLIQGIVLQNHESINAQAIVEAAICEKLLVISAGPEVVRIVPPLTINKREVRQLLLKLEKTFRRFN